MDFPRAEALPIAKAPVLAVRVSLGLLPRGLFPGRSDREAVMSTFHKSSGAHGVQNSRRILDIRWTKAGSLSNEYSTANFTETT
jgi:hypothetical protein